MCRVFPLKKNSENDWVLLFALFVVVYFGHLISFLSTQSNSAKEAKKTKQTKKQTLEWKKFTFGSSKRLFLYNLLSKFNLLSNNGNLP